MMEEERMPMMLPREEEGYISIDRRARRPSFMRRAMWVLAAVVGVATLSVLVVRAPRAQQHAVARGAALQDADESDDFAAPSAVQAQAHVPWSAVDLRTKCRERYFTQALDHFVPTSNATFEERYFVCAEHSRPNGSIFFYVGNEADVELYLNNTGLMWENAAEFGAMLVFAEHRYFGKSVPFGDDVRHHMQFLSTTQAMADYAVLIEAIKEEYKLNVPVIGFGGSYGGMLGSWFRMKYPHILDGVIAASAPIAAFLGDEVPVDMESFGRVVTFDASPEGGSAANCVPNVRRVWEVMMTLGKTEQGRRDLATALALCGTEKIETEDDVKGLIGWASDAFNMMAMGEYPYPSPYIMNGMSVLPAYPVRVACSHLNETYAKDDTTGLLNAFRGALGVYYNTTLDQACFSRQAPSNESARDGDFWNYIFCSEIYMPTKLDGVHDMFLPSAWNMTADNEMCANLWNVTLRPHWAITQYGGRKALAAASNIVLSNGNYDPWSGTGILKNISNTVVAVPVDGGAHHLDLFFSNPLDSPGVKQAREIEKQHMWRWVHQFYAEQQVDQALPADTPVSKSG